MILAVMRDDYDRFLVWYESWADLHTDTFNSGIEIEWCWDGKAHGKSYAERKSFVREKAIDYSNTWVFEASYRAVANAEDLFEKAGKRYGLLTEFRENGIC